MRPSSPSDPIKSAAQALRPKLADWRRAFHMRPELSGEEQQTARSIAAQLRGLGLTVKTGVGGYGVLGVLEGNHVGPTIAYRADMDALPIQETRDRPYASLELGVSHACGHDVHMATALGIADLLSGMRPRLRGRVIFVFQPAEESLSGARAMLDEGTLLSHDPSAILALHAFPIPVGTLGVALDLCAAGMEEFRVRFYAPSGNLDAITTRAISDLMALSTAQPPTTAEGFSEIAEKMEEGSGLRDTVFLSCWRHPPGSIPRAHLLGLVSISDFGRRASVRARIRETLDAIAEAYGAAYDLAYTFQNPPLHNDPDLVAEILPVVEESLGPAHVRKFSDPYPFAHEDFALYAAQMPAALLWLGTANRDRGIDSLLHTADYDVDEASLVLGAEVMTKTILHLLDSLPRRTRRERQDNPRAHDASSPVDPLFQSGG